MTSEQTIALQAVASAVAQLRASDYHATADWLEQAVIALADECDQQRTRAEAAEQELRERGEMFLCKENARLRAELREREADDAN